MEGNKHTQIKPTFILFCTEYKQLKALKSEYDNPIIVHAVCQRAENIRSIFYVYDIYVPPQTVCDGNVSIDKYEYAKWRRQLSKRQEENIRATFFVNWDKSKNDNTDKLLTFFKGFDSYKFQYGTDSYNRPDDFYFTWYINSYDEIECNSNVRMIDNTFSGPNDCDFIASIRNDLYKSSIYSEIYIKATLNENNLESIIDKYLQICNTDDKLRDLFNIINLKFIEHSYYGWDESKWKEQSIFLDKCVRKIKTILDEKGIELNYE